MLTLWTGSLRWAFPLVQEFRATALGCEQIKELLALSAEREMVMALFGVGEGRKKTTDWEKYGNFPWDGCPQLSKARINAFLSRDATERLIIELRYLDRLFQDDERFPPSFSDVCLDPLMATWNAIPEHVYKNYAATEWLPRLENIRSRFSFAEGNHESQAEHD